MAAGPAGAGVTGAGVAGAGAVVCPNAMDGVTNDAASRATQAFLKIMPPNRSDPAPLLLLELTPRAIEDARIPGHQGKSMQGGSIGSVPFLN
jgi:hypothetical protein